MNYTLCELHITYTILSKYEQTTHYIQIAPCFPWSFNCFGMLQVREKDFAAQQFWWSWVSAHLRGNIADDAMQMDVQKTLYPFYTAKKKPLVTVAITKNASLAAIARYIRITTNYIVRNLQIFNAGHFFSSKHCNDL